MRNTWTVHSTENVTFGRGAIQKLPGILHKINAKNILMVTDQGIKGAGILQKVKNILDPFFNVSIYDQAVPEPPVESAIECVEITNKSKIDAIVGLGGGSSIDLAKIVALLLAHGGHPRDYFGENNVPGPIAPLVAVPTTAGTGSEVTSVTVLTDQANQVKTGVSDNYLRPHTALLDPELTKDLPPYITACSGIDALCHAVEAFTAKDSHYVEAEGELLFQGSNPYSDALALQAINLISKSLPLAVNQGANMQARADMLLGSLLAGQAFSNAGTAAAHALAYPIGGLVHSPHGELTGLLLPYVLYHNYPVISSKLAQAERNIEPRMGAVSEDEAAASFIKRIERLLVDIQLPTQLKDIGMKEEDISSVAGKALNIDRLIRGNPRVPTQKSFETLLIKAYGDPRNAKDSNYYR